ncbi:hypothetical protein [Anatilimnocola floriformis]|uniref:hypothetical protein n=1 Tax=Anatilimnocola floriformis TaxID=2948575 RepID=UPI0020C486B3|nr:hypothetical protein [Anatilimnocola floriformis]
MGSFTLRALFAILILTATNSLWAEESWGDLTASFVFDGETPEPRKLKIDKDTYLYKDPIYDPALLVDRETKGIANVVVWLVVAPEDKPPAIHASYEKLAKQDVEVDTIKGLIEPHVALVWLPQTLLLKNSEPIGHHIRLNGLVPTEVSALVPAHGTTKRKFTKQQNVPWPIDCSIHPWESGYLVIRDNPYMAVSDAQGKLRIKNLPTGKHTFVFWHEQGGYLKDIKRDGKAEVLKLGRLTVDVKSGDNDLGEFSIKPARQP